MRLQRWEIAAYIGLNRIPTIPRYYLFRQSAANTAASLNARPDTHGRRYVVLRRPQQLVRQ